MSDSDAPDQDPKTQPKWSGGPPKPPKITARGVEDGSPKEPNPILNLIRAQTEAQRLMELLESIRGSRLHALNMLEADLDICVVWMDKIFQHLKGKDCEMLMWHLKTIRDYRHRHPRLETGDRELREQARKVLDEIKKGEVKTLQATGDGVSSSVIADDVISPAGRALNVRCHSRAMTLTAAEKKTLERVSRPSWPRLTLYLFIVIVVCGVLSLGLAIHGCIRLSHMVSDINVQPGFVTVLQECWLALVIGSTALVSSFFIWATRSCGLLIRKLGKQDDTEPGAVRPP